eukprot:3907800-Karenia_brevis.AAC.1
MHEGRSIPVPNLTLVPRILAEVTQPPQTVFKKTEILCEPSLDKTSINPSMSDGSRKSAGTVGSYWQILLQMSSLSLKGKQTGCSTW